MRILFFITKSEQGGAQTHVAQLCEWLIQHGQEVAIMSRPDGWLEKETRRLGARFFPNDAIANSANPFTFLTAKKQFLAAVDEFKPDLVTCHSTMAGLVGRLSLRGRIPTIFTAHGWGFTQGSPLMRRILLPFLERLAGRWSRRIICVSKNDLALATAHHIALASKLTVVYNGVERALQVSPASKTAPHIFFVGRLAPPKDPFLLIKSFTSLPRELQDHIHITIIGDGPDRANLKRTIDKHGLHEHITLTGALPREQVLNRLRDQADIFVLLSHWEGFPYSVLEAMAAGVPIIASNVGGIAEALEHGGGILVENDIQRVTQALRILLNDEQARTKLSKEARESIEAHFRVEDMCEKTFAVYKQALLQ